MITLKNLTLMKEEGKLHVDDVVSKRRIWQQIIKKSLEEIKRTELEQILEEQRTMNQRFDAMEKMIRSLSKQMDSSG